MLEAERYLRRQLEARKQENNFRQLRLLENKIDFTSNDYLGLARDPHFRQMVTAEITALHPQTGSTGSRLLSGNSAIAEDLEHQIAGFHKSESALLFNSGFDANYGLLKTLPYRGDTVLFDELCHASVHDGLRAGKASAIAFQHNDVMDLEEKLTSATGIKYVVTESLFSMDGDVAPLRELAAVCEKHGAALIVDEAHATGVYGKSGEGLVQHLGLESRCFARIHTFGKAMGSFGAVILGSESLRQFLINYCRPFIFSTALPPQLLLQIKCAYQYIPGLQARREKIHSLAQLLQSGVQNWKKGHLLPGLSPIQSLMIPGNAQAKQLAQTLQQQGFDARAILYPTVARGKERIRLCLHSFNTESEIEQLITILQA
ncbi:MAG: 8-amino-7-oxononanoate synthase [Chitinophagales bacterium]